MIYQQLLIAQVIALLELVLLRSVKHRYVFVQKFGSKHTCTVLSEDKFFIQDMHALGVAESFCVLLLVKSRTCDFMESMPSKGVMNVN